MAASLAGGTFHSAVLFGSHGRGSSSRGTGLCPSIATSSTIISTPVVTSCLIGSSLASCYRLPVICSSSPLSARLSGHTASCPVVTKCIIDGGKLAGACNQFLFLHVMLKVWKTNVYPYCPKRFNSTVYRTCIIYLLTYSMQHSPS